MATPSPPKATQPRPVQAWRFIRNSGDYLTGLHSRHGDVFGINFQRRPWTLICSPEGVREVFTASPSALRAGEGNEILGTSLGSHSVLLLDGDEHLRQRRLLLPPFHGEMLQAQRSKMEEVAERIVAELPRRTPFAMRPRMQRIALEVILEVVLGLEPQDPMYRPISEATWNFLEWIGGPKTVLLPGTFGPQSWLVRRMYAPYLRPLDAGIHELIRQRREVGDVGDRDDILSMLLLARDEDGTGMSDAELRDELVTLVVAGHETTSTALSWAFERLTRNPSALARLEQEATTEGGQWAECVAREALRLRPVLDFVVRRAGEPIEIQGYAFEPGDFVVPCIKLVHLREDIYPEADRFKPERWLDQKPGTYTWIPFGGGTRRCIGMQFAMMEMDVVMRAVARGAHLEPVGETEKPVARFITTSPSRGGEVLINA